MIYRTKCAYKRYEVYQSVECFISWDSSAGNHRFVTFVRFFSRACVGFEVFFFILCLQNMTVARDMNMFWKGIEGTWKRQGEEAGKRDTREKAGREREKTTTTTTTSVECRTIAQNFVRFGLWMNLFSTIGYTQPWTLICIALMCINLCTARW